MLFLSLQNTCKLTCHIPRIFRQVVEVQIVGQLCYALHGSLIAHPEYEFPLLVCNAFQVSSHTLCLEGLEVLFLCSYHIPCGLLFYTKESQLLFANPKVYDPISRPFDRQEISIFIFDRFDSTLLPIPDSSYSLPEYFVCVPIV